MPAMIEIPAALQKFVDNQSRVEVTEGNVQEALDNLVTQYGDLRQHLLDEQGKVRSFVNIYLNDEDIRIGQNMETPVKSGDVIQIVPSIAGGR